MGDQTNSMIRFLHVERVFQAVWLVRFVHLSISYGSIADQISLMGKTDTQESEEQGIDGCKALYNHFNNGRVRVIDKLGKSVKRL